MSQATVTTTDSGASSGRTDSLPVVAAKFLLPSAVGTAAWLGLIVYLQPGEESANPSALWGASLGEILFVILLVGVVGSVLVAAAIHLHSPREYVDRYHLLGVHLAMFAAINATITTVSLAVWAVGNWTGTLFWGPDGLIAFHAIAMVIMSSLFLPGPYAGALIGRWWSN